MLFSSVPFLYFFLPAVLLFYAIVPKAWKNAVLLLFSLIFYFYGEPVYTLLILGQALSGYLHGLWIAHTKKPRTRKAALVSSLVIGLGALGIFKYTDFAIGTANAILGTSWSLVRLALPIGISFYTFQTLSYTIDIYRGSAHVQRSFLKFATYVTLFPQLIAGPIVRYTDVAAELDKRKTTLDGFASGVRRFVLGLCKKVLIANVLGELVAYCAAAGAQTVLLSWLYAAGYALQIYFDFSGYSDMAIGLGAMFGFRFPENFNYPYIAKSITDFWRRWHMTLSQWFRDYVYIPLGGNRVSKPRWLLNIAVVWALTGLWHGASWTFVAWGLYFAVLLCLEKLFLLKLLERLPSFVRHLYTVLIVVVSFVLFNASSFSSALATLSGMFGSARLAFSDAYAVYALRSFGVTLLIACIGATPLPKLAAEQLLSEEKRAVLRGIAEPALLCVLLLITTAYLVDGSFNPFLYFRF